MSLQKSYQKKCNEYIIQQVEEQEEDYNPNFEEQIQEFLIRINIEAKKHLHNFQINTDSYFQDNNDIISDQIIFPFSFDLLYGEKDLQNQAYQEDKPFFFQHSKVDHYKLEDFSQYKEQKQYTQQFDITLLGAFWEQWGTSQQQSSGNISQNSTNTGNSNNFSNFQNIQNLYKSDKVFDITDNYFRENYVKIALLGGGSFGKVELYYEKIINKLLAVKTFTKKQKVKNKNGQSEEKKFDLDLCQEELQNIVEGLHTQKFNDQQIADRRRNIEREILLAHGLSKDNNPYISKFVGLVLIHTDEEKQNQQQSQQNKQITSNNSLSNNNQENLNNTSLNNIQSSQNVQGNFSQKNLEDCEENLSVKSNNTNNEFGSPKKKKKNLQQNQKNIQKIEEEDDDEEDQQNLQEKQQNQNRKWIEEEAAKYKTVKIVFEYFGCYGYNSSQKKIFTPDLRSYIKRNAKNQSLFYNSKQKKQLIQEVLQQLLQSFYYLHEKQNVFLRDFKDDNIIVRRVYNPENPGTYSHQIRICDFGLAKQFPLEELVEEQKQKQIEKQLKMQKQQQKQNVQQNSDNSDDEEDQSSNSSSSYSSSYSQLSDDEDDNQEYSSDDVYGWKKMPQERQVSVTKYKNFRNLYTHPKLMIEKYLNANNALFYDKKDDVYSLGIVLIKLHEVLKLNFEKSDAPIIQDLTGFQFKEILKFYKNRNYQKDNSKDKVCMIKVLQELLEFRDRKSFKKRHGKWRSKYIYKCWQNVQPIEDIVQIYGKNNQNQNPLQQLQQMQQQQQQQKKSQNQFQQQQQQQYSGQKN